MTESGRWEFIFDNMADLLIKNTLLVYISPDYGPLENITLISFVTDCYWLINVHVYVYMYICI